MEKSKVLESKDVIGNYVGNGHNSLTADSPIGATGDLPDTGNVPKLSHSGLESTTETDTSCDVLAGKLDAMNVSVQEVDGQEDELKAVWWYAR